MKAIKGPLNYIPLMVVGGISYKNIDAYMEAGAAGAGIGGEIANKKIGLNPVSLKKSNRSSEIDYRKNCMEERMSRVVTFGEIMMRLNPEGYMELLQAPSLNISFAGGEANAAVSIANFGMDVEFCN